MFILLCESIFKQVWAVLCQAQQKLELVLCCFRFHIIQADGFFFNTSQLIYRVFQKKSQNVCLFNISKTYKQIFKSFFTSENWDPYVNFEYKINVVLFQGAEIFAN